MRLISPSTTAARTMQCRGLTSHSQSNTVCPLRDSSQNVPSRDALLLFLCLFVVCLFVVCLLVVCLSAWLAVSLPASSVSQHAPAASVTSKESFRAVIDSQGRVACAPVSAPVPRPAVDASIVETEKKKKE